jgi:hypothetical protein
MRCDPIAAERWCHAKVRLSALAACGVERTLRGKAIGKLVELSGRRLAAQAGFSFSRQMESC